MQQAPQSVQMILRQPQFEQRVVAALRRVSVMEGTSEDMDEEWFTQTVRGFINVTLEAAETAERQTRDMFFATIVPGILAEGLSPGVLLRSSTTFLSLLGNELALEVPAADKALASDWFASFAGSYIEGLYNACLAAP